MKQIKISEKDNQNLFRQYLEIKGFSVYRVNNIATPIIDKGKIFYRKGVQKKGLPDLIAIHPTKKLIIFVECKSSTGTPSPEQIEFQRIADGCKTIAVIAKKLEIIEERLKDL